MIYFSQSRRYLGLAGLVAAVSCAALAGAPAMAAAGTTHARAAHGVTPAFKQEGCDGDVCMILTVTGSPAFTTIFAAANTHNFTGYFHLSGPGGPFHPANSQTQVWPAHGLVNGVNFYLTNLQPLDGTYCASGFEQNGMNIGKPCITYSG